MKVLFFNITQAPQAHFIPETRIFYSLALKQEYFIVLVLFFPLCCKFILGREKCRRLKGLLQVIYILTKQGRIKREFFFCTFLLVFLVTPCMYGKKQVVLDFVTHINFFLYIHQACNKRCLFLC